MDVSNDDEDPMVPRRLTSDEISDILSVIPDLKSSAEEVGDFNRDSMLATLKEQLKEIVITPLGIPDMKDELLRQFFEALIKPGSAVGVTAAEALGGPITQMALNSFHQSGSSKNVTYGIDGATELIYATENPKNPSCSIFFKNQKLSFDDIITRVRPILRDIRVKDIVKGIPDIESTDQLEEPWWYQPFKYLIRDDFESNSILILEIDTELLYSYKITMEDVCNVIEKGQPVICVYSPMNIGEIHIYPIEKSILAKIKSEGTLDKKSASMVFLWKVVIPALDELKIQGITGIKQLYPVETPVWQIVKDEQKSNVDKVWFLILNKIRMKVTGIRTEKLIHLCEVSGVKVIKVRPDYIAVQTETGESPTKIVNNMIKEDKENEKEYERRRRKEGARIIRRPPTDISKAAVIVYSDTDGSLFKGDYSTLRALLAHPNIDSTRTYGNNVHEVNAVLGIEAARSLLIKKFIELISAQGSYINPRHIVLLSDFMVSLGKVNGITFTGVSRQPIGALEKASFQKAMDSFKEAAGFGEKKPIVGVSASIYVGKQALIGTGYSEQYMDSSKFKEVEEEIEDNPDMKLDIGSFKDAISGMNDLLSGVDMLTLEGAEEEMFGGEGPSLPGGKVIQGGDTVPDSRLFDQIKGPLIRSTDLEEAAVRLNNAPCLRGPPRKEVSVDAVRSDLSIEALPFSGITEAALPYDQEPSLERKGYTFGDMGLPEDLLTELENIIPNEPPKVAELPKTGLPSVPLAPIETVGGFVPTSEEPVEEPMKIVFDLDSFLG